MINLRTHLDRLIETSLIACQSWLCTDGANGLRMIDPVDQKVVVSHYGDSHLAAALIILGRMKGEQPLVDQGLQIAETVVRDWASSIKIADFHHDFNNFGLCLIAEYTVDMAPALAKKIRALVLATRDSNHDTINWLPMRAYANACRYEWTGDERYRVAADVALTKVSKATNADGGIEDRLPKGASYNLQYHIASLAGLQLLSRRWPQRSTKTWHCLNFLIKRMLPDGDINYCGRGTNQIFAWGTWLYSLASCGISEALGEALKFLDGRYARAAESNNILLNDFVGHEKSFWWDYHYCSVYHAHFLLWSVLALRDIDATRASGVESSDIDTGLECITGTSGGVAIFSGRSIYLSEAGPAVCALWLLGRGTLFKGGLGPWQGMFGKHYSFADTVLQNHFGLVLQGTQRRSSWNQLKRRFRVRYEEERGALTCPIFADICVTNELNELEIVFETAEPVSAYLNVPIFDEKMGGLKLKMSVDGCALPAMLSAKSRNQYGWISVNRSHVAHGRFWKVSIQ